MTQGMIINIPSKWFHFATGTSGMKGSLVISPSCVSCLCYYLLPLGINWTVSLWWLIGVTPSCWRAGERYVGDSLWCKLGSHKNCAACCFIGMVGWGGVEVTNGNLSCHCVNWLGDCHPSNCPWRPATPAIMTCQPSNCPGETSHPSNWPVDLSTCWICKTFAYVVPSPLSTSWYPPNRAAPVLYTMRVVLELLHFNFLSLSCIMNESCRGSLWWTPPKLSWPLVLLFEVPVCNGVMVYIVETACI